MRVLNIPDAHLGARRYGKNKRWDTIVYDAAFNTFSSIISQAIDPFGVDAITVSGDMLDKISVDDAGWMRLLTEVERLRKAGIQLVILGGNHDSVKSYDRVGGVDALNALSNVTVINGFIPEVVTVGNVPNSYFQVGGIPHCKSQNEFQRFVNEWNTKVNILLLHASVGDYSQSTRMGPNNLWLTVDQLARLKAYADFIVVGHEHSQRDILENVWQVGATMPFAFSELGTKWLVLMDTITKGAEKYAITQSLTWTDLEFEFSSRDDLAVRLAGRPQSVTDVVRMNVFNVPAEHYGLSKLMCNMAQNATPGVFLCDLHRVGDLEVKDISNESVKFDLTVELEEHCKKTKASQEDTDALKTYIEDAINQYVNEED